ncbi:hypothetical protein AAF712_005995 [Marasmius tenuissimus]|uniref:Zinc/iron permease n=1 Tax=Marasmius tenuissimus TaxID=585030 RepID=A0ABR3A0Y5_9AGAR
MGIPAEGIEHKLGTMAIIFGISLFAVSFPAISQKTSFLPIPKIVFFIGKHFGTGVILSTAFVHLLKDSFESLSDPLVKSRYPGVSDQIGLIILGSLLLIFLVEYISTSVVDHLHRHGHEHEHGHDEEEPTATNSPQVEQLQLPSGSDENTPLLAPSRYSHEVSHHSHESSRHSHFNTLKRQSSHYLTSIVTNSPRHARSTEYFYIINDVNHHINNGEYHLVGGKKGQGGPCVCVCVCPAGQGGPTIKNLPDPVRITQGEEESGHGDEEEETPQLSRKRQIVGILVLQMGIMIHSLVIGLTLAITSGSEFATLTTAIVFHQLFEGLSLGIRIAAIPPPPLSHDPPTLPLHNAKPSDEASTASGNGWLKPILSILFAVTTPAGICLGILLFSVSGTHSEQAKMMLTQGLMSAISAGMLIYAGTVEMLAADFVFAIGSSGGHGHSHGEEFMTEEGAEGQGADESSWRKKAIALVSLCAGVAGMSLVGLGE